MATVLTDKTRSLGFKARLMLECGKSSSSKKDTASYLAALSHIVALRVFSSDDYRPGQRLRVRLLTKQDGADAGPSFEEVR